jgi:hypothetical protein
VTWGIEHRRSDIYFESRGKTIKFCRNEIDILVFGTSELESNLVGVNTCCFGCLLRFTPISAARDRIVHLAQSLSISQMKGF